MITKRETVFETEIQTVLMSPSNVNVAVRDGRFRHALRLAVLQLAAAQA
jgi:hypothetical protein